MVGHAEIPSFLEMVMSLPLSPIVTTSSRFSFLVRSGLIASHESPRSVLRNTRLAAASNTPGLVGDSSMGVSQWKRYVSPAVALVTFCGVGRMDLDSPVTLLRRVMLPSCDSV